MDKAYTRGKTTQDKMMLQMSSISRPLLSSQAAFSWAVMDMYISIADYYFGYQHRGGESVAVAGRLRLKSSFLRVFCITT